MFFQPRICADDTDQTRLFPIRVIRDYPRLILSVRPRLFAAECLDQVLKAGVGRGESPSRAFQAHDVAGGAVASVHGHHELREAEGAIFVELRRGGEDAVAEGGRENKSALTRRPPTRGREK